MDEGARTGGTQQLTNGHAKDPEAIRRHIEATREELGDTVAALAIKADVKAQARDRVEEAKQRARAKRAELVGRVRGATPASVGSAGGTAVERVRANPVPAAVATALLVGVLLGRVTAR